MKSSDDKFELNTSTSIEKKINPLNTFINFIQQRLTIIETLIVLIFSAVIGIAFAFYGRGGPNSSDITLYMNLGLNGIRMPFVLNRYFNIFMQQLFVSIAPNPIEGYHYYWGFLMGITTFLIYISGRYALSKSNAFNGVLAVAIFYSMSVLAGLSGVIVVDFPAMVVITAMFTAYIISANHGHTKPLLIAAIGILFYLAFKTKETTMPVAVILIGLGWVGDKRFNWRLLFKNLLWVFAGVLIGIIIFAFLSWAILEDPFFGLRISEWQEFRDTYAVYSSNVFATMNAMEDGVMDDWYKGYWFEYAMLPFLLFLISGFLAGREASYQRRVLWLAPLAFVVLMIFTINNRLGYESRFGLPVIPIVSILAPQFISLNLPKTKKSQLKFWISLAAGLIIVIGIRVLLRLIIPPLNYDLGSVVLLMYYPVFFTFLLFSLFFFTERPVWHLINFFIVVSLLWAPIASNFRAMFIVKENHQEFTKIVLPFSEFESEIEFFPEMRFFASYHAFRASKTDMVKNIDELLSLFNVYFDAQSTRESFVFQEDNQNISEDLLFEDFDYILLSSVDWMRVQRNEDNLEQMLERYQVYFGDGERLVLLVEK